MVLGYISIVEIGKTKVEKDIEKKSKIKNGKVKSVIGSTYNVLHRSIDTQNPKRLNQQIEQ